MVVYVAIFSMLITVILQLSMRVQMTGSRVRISNEIKENVSQFTQIVTALVREGNSLDIGNSVFDVHPGKLVVSNGAEIATIETYTKQVTMGGASVAIRKLRFLQGSNPPIDLTSDHVDVTDFRLVNLSQAGSPDVIQLFFELSNVNPSGDPSFESRLSVSSSIAVRAES